MSPANEHDTTIPQSGDGLWLQGQFLSTKVQHGRPRANGEGNWPDRQIVTILTGDRTVQVEYRDETAVRAAFGGTMPQPTERVRIPVGNRAAKGFVFYYGRNALTGSDDQ